MKNKTPCLRAALGALAFGFASLSGTDAKAQPASGYFVDAGLVESTAFQQLVAMRFEGSAIETLAGIDTTLETGAVKAVRIRHHYMPRHRSAYAMPSKQGPARALTEADTQVRVVYASFMADAQPIDFSAR